MEPYQRFLEKHVADHTMPVRFPIKNKVPYDRRGNLLTSKEDLNDTKSKKNWTTWDLSRDARLKLHKDNNCKGSQQPSYVNLPGKVGVVKGFDQFSRGIIVTFEDRGHSRQTVMGEWWIEAAMKGTVPTLPFVNA